MHRFSWCIYMCGMCIPACLVALMCRVMVFLHEYCFMCTLIGMILKTIVSALVMNSDVSFLRLLDS